MNTKQLLVLALGSAWLGIAQAQTQTQTEKPAAAAPSDAQIAMIVVVANQADIDAAKVAKAHASNPAVKDFANTMIRDHEASNKEAKALAKQLKLTPKESDTSKQLAKASKENLATLKKAKGPAFDKAYVDHEVAYHEQVIDAVNSTLLPSAQNPQLKALLEKSAPVFQAHLDHAKQLQGQLGSAGTAAAPAAGGAAGSGTGSGTGASPGGSTK